VGRREPRRGEQQQVQWVPAGKSWDTFQWSRVPKLVTQQMQSLRDGPFLDRRESVLVFGTPGSGKTHALCALGEQLVLQGRSVYFASCSLLVQELLVAEWDLKREKVIKRLAGFEALILDDLGYVQQSCDEIEALFTLLAQRYPRLTPSRHSTCGKKS
jgi:DNA replication protein DnaC